MISDIAKEAISLILHGDKELLKIVALSLEVSGSALIFSTALGLPLAALMGLAKFPGKTFLVNLINTFMGIPPVVVGLVLYLLLSRSGILGFMGLLYTPTAMMIAQTVLSFPIVVALCHTAIVSVDPIIRQAAEALGATRLQVAMTVIREARYGIISAITAAFGRLMAEVGAILIVGGNIAGYTRVMTTTIAMETDKGNFELAVALGIILLSISMVINLLICKLQGKKGSFRTL
jgi:tungstate transport system permease protein